MLTRRRTWKEETEKAGRSGRFWLRINLPRKRAGRVSGCREIFDPSFDEELEKFSFFLLRSPPTWPCVLPHVNCMWDFKNRLFRSFFFSVHKAAIIGTVVPFQAIFSLYNWERWVFNVIDRRNVIISFARTLNRLSLSFHFLINLLTRRIKMN